LIERALDQVPDLVLLHDRSAPDWVTDTMAARGCAIAEIHRIAVWEWAVAKTHDGDDHAAKRKADLTDVAILLSTSGSTGLPKIVPVTHEAIAATIQRAAQGLDLVPGEKTLNVMALNHVHGLISGVLLPWIAGCCTVMPGPYRAADFLRWMQDARPSWMSCSPAIYADVLRRAEAESVALDSYGVRFVRCGSAALNSTLRDRIKRAFGVPLLEAYGMSEALQIAGVPYADPREGTVGTAVVDEIGIFDGATRRDTGQMGEICLRGRTVMSGYLGAPRRAQDDWFRTGDIGYLDGDGFLRVCGRSGDQIIVGGENVAPQEVEEEISKLPGVAEVAVFAAEHSSFGERIVTAVVLEAGATLNARELRDALLDRLPRHKVPSQTIFADALPVGGTGKVARSKLAAHFKDQLELAEAANDLRPPTGALETWLLHEFSQVLRGVEIGIDSDFFEMGGTSHDAVELTLSLEERLDETIHVALLFAAPTVAELAARMRRDYPTALERAELAEPMSPDDTQRATGGDAFEAFRASLPVLPPVQDPPSDQEPVFILSAPRCGSTLLRVMLAGHPDLFAPPELRLMNFADLSDWSQALDGQFRFFRDGLVQAVMAATDMPEDTARKTLDGFAQDGWSSARVLTWLQDQVPGRTLVDKTPIYALTPSVLSRIHASFPKARFIVLLRNPVDMVRSYEQARMHQVWMYPQPGGSADLAQMIWRQTYQTIDAFRDRVEHKRIMHVSFETLVREPEILMPKICRFLRVPYDTAVLTPHEDPTLRMTKGLGPAARMIGDPRFAKHRKIDASRAGSGSVSPLGAMSDATRALAAKFGYGTQGQDAPEASIVHRMRLMTADWGKGAQRLGDFAFGRNLSDETLPLFWVCQRDFEGRRLGRVLGKRQPLIYLRSGDYIVNRYDRAMDDLAKHYARTIADIQPSGPIAIGGNCQGAELARATAKQLRALGREIALLIALDADFDDPLPVPTAFVFGQTSHANPLRTGDARRAVWDGMYPSHSVDVLPCGHGKYFGVKTKMVDRLADIIVARCSTLEGRKARIGKRVSLRAVLGKTRRVFAKFARGQAGPRG
jgi:acyl-CoA synthetase (AMP-forming)/AMP-acid ligase II/acyl carrier protein